jgi:hypothetical protein
MPKRLTSVTGLLTLVLAFAGAAPASAAPWQCVTFARAFSGVDLHGDAATWWGQATGKYDQGSIPRVGAVLVFKAAGAMRVGRVKFMSPTLTGRRLQAIAARSRPTSPSSIPRRRTTGAASASGIVRAATSDGAIIRCSASFTAHRHRPRRPTLPLLRSMQCPSSWPDSDRADAGSRRTGRFRRRRAARGGRRPLQHHPPDPRRLDPIGAAGRA